MERKEKDQAMSTEGKKKENVYNAVFADIIRKEYDTDSIITEKSLIEKYQVSKSPIREALLQLCNDGILVSLPRIGYKIKPVSMKDLSDASTLRILIETTALELVFDRITEAHIKALEALIEEGRSLLTVRDVYQHWQLNRRFHLTLCSFANNNAFTQTLDTLMITCFRGISGYYEDSWNMNQNKGDMKYHLQLIEAIRNRNLQKSKEILKADISDLKEYFSNHSITDNEAISKLFFIS